MKGIENRTRIGALFTAGVLAAGCNNDGLQQTTTGELQWFQVRHASTSQVCYPDGSNISPRDPDARPEEQDPDHTTWKKTVVLRANASDLDTENTGVAFTSDGYIGGGETLKGEKFQVRGRESIAATYRGNTDSCVSFVVFNGGDSRTIKKFIPTRMVVGPPPPGVPVS